MSDSDNDQSTVDATSYPLCFHSTLLETEIEQRECSDGIYLSNNRFRHFNFTDSEELVIIKISYGGRTTYANIIGVHTDDYDVVYMPQWMCTYLGNDCGSTVNLSKLRDYKLGMNIRIQPHTSDYAKLEDPAAALRDGFENYTTLQAGMDIPLLVGNSRLIVTIIDTQHREPICIRGMELSVEIDRPLDIPESNSIVEAYQGNQGNQNNQINQNNEDIDFDSMVPIVTTTTKFPGIGHTLGSARR